MEERIAIVGGGLTAGRVVQSYRQAGGQEPITLVSADSWPPYHRPPLSKGFLRGESEAAVASLEKAAARRRRYTIERARNDPAFERLRREPRFRELIGTT